MSSGNTRNTLWVGNLHRKVTELQILKVFGKYGKVVREEFLWHRSGPRQGRPKGCCFVEFSSYEEAFDAMAALNGKMLHGQPIRIHKANERKDFVRYKTPQAREAARRAAARSEAAAARQAAADAHDAQAQASSLRNKLEMLRMKRKAAKLGVPLDVLIRAQRRRAMQSAATASRRAAGSGPLPTPIAAPAPPPPKAPPSAPAPTVAAASAKTSAPAPASSAKTSAPVPVPAAKTPAPAPVSATTTSAPAPGSSTKTSAPAPASSTTTFAPAATTQFGEKRKRLPGGGESVAKKPRHR